jgi:hypothetical protein
MDPKRSPGGIDGGDLLLVREQGKSEAYFAGLMEWSLKSYGSDLELEMRFALRAADTGKHDKDGN